MRRRRRLAILLLTVSAWLGSAARVGHPQPPGAPAPGPMPRRSIEAVQGSYYLPDHFYWYGSAPDKAREKKSLLPLLSSSHAVVGFTWTAATRGQETAKRAKLQEFLRRPPAGLPVIASTAECDHGPSFVAFLLTLRGDGGPGRMLSFLNALHAQNLFDFVAPAFFLPEKLAYPFPEFEVEFLPTALIGDGDATIKRFNAANHVAVVSINDNLYTLGLQRDTPTNVLATVLKYLETPWLVKHARLSWRGVLRPLTASAELRTPLKLALVEIRDPIEYVVTIDRDRDVTVLPEMTSQADVKGWMIKALEVPEEVVDLKEITRTTTPLGPSRERDRVRFVFLFSKAGVYDLPAWEVKYSAKDLSGGQKVERVVAGGPFRLTVDEHLPRHVPGIPGTPFVVPGTALRARPTTGVAARGLLAAGGALVVAVAFSRAMPWWRARRTRALLAADARAAVDSYRSFWDRTDQAAATLLWGDPSAEKSWLRDAGKAVRRFLGARVCGDEAAFLGGAGTSAAEIRAVARARGDVNVDDVLAVLEELDAISDVAEPRLGRQQAGELRRRVTAVMNEAPR